MGNIFFGQCESKPAHCIIIILTLFFSIHCKLCEEIKTVLKVRQNIYIHAYIEIEKAYSLVTHAIINWERTLKILASSHQISVMQRHYYLFRYSSVSRSKTESRHQNSQIFDLP